MREEEGIWIGEDMRVLDAVDDGHGVVRRGFIYTADCGQGVYTGSGRSIGPISGKLCGENVLRDSEVCRSVILSRVVMQFVSVRCKVLVKYIKLLDMVIIN